MSISTDLLIIGAGTAGLPAAIEASNAGAHVVLVEQTDRIGGTLHVSAAQMSGAGTRLQAARGIADSPQAHYEDVMRISRGTAHAGLARKAVGLGGSTIDWLMDNGFDMAPECPAILHFHEAYRTPRTCWGVDGGRSVLKVLRALFDDALGDRRIELMLQSEAVELLRIDGGIRGATIQRGTKGPCVDVLAGATVLASGGYGGNSKRFADWNEGLQLFTAALPTATGSGIELGLKAGGRLVSGQHHLPTFAGIVRTPGQPWIDWDSLPQLTPQVRPPWEIYVGRDGRRFVREDVDSVDARERALATLPELTFFAVFDDRIWREAPPLLPGWPPDTFGDAWNGHASFHVAETLDALAGAACIDGDGLADTIDVYNQAVAGGRPDPFGRQHLPAPIAEPPFRAIMMHGMVLKTAAGLAVDEALRVLDPDGWPIPGLYAVGEAIGGGTLSGNAFVGGMSVTPALGFGRWLGQTLGRAAVAGRVPEKVTV
ncbi:MAG: FAD-binding protein [Pseudomonadota bacterium]